jgi:diamine N-acetyltransferase
MFDNFETILNLAPDPKQQHFVKPASHTIALAFAGTNEGYPGFLRAIYYSGAPVGIILIGRGLVQDDEPEALQKYEYVYRILGFFIDKNFQHKGIGKAALKLALEKVKCYPNAQLSPVYLQCHKENKVALSLYESFGFQNINEIIGENYVLVRFPK